MKNKKFEFNIKADWKALILGIIVLVIAIGLPILFTQVQLFGISESYESRTILQATEKVGELALVKMKFQKVLDPKVVPNVLGYDVPLLESKALVILTSEASACVDLKKLTKDGVEFGDGIVKLKLQKPYVCNERILMSDVKKYDVNVMAVLFHPDLPDNAIKKAENDITLEAEESGILEMAKVQAEAFLPAMLSSITERKVVVEFI